MKNERSEKVTKFNEAFHAPREKRAKEKRQPRMFFQSVQTITDEEGKKRLRSFTYRKPKKSVPKE